MDVFTFRMLSFSSTVLKTHDDKNEGAKRIHLKNREKRVPLFRGETMIRFMKFSVQYSNVRRSFGRREPLPFNLMTNELVKDP